MSADLQTCRLCGDSNYETRGHKYPLIRYSTRHSVHADCGLAKWGVAFFDRLTVHQLRIFPALAAMDAGLLNELRARAGFAEDRQAEPMPLPDKPF